MRHVAGIDQTIRATLFKEPVLIAGDGARAFVAEADVALYQPAAHIAKYRQKKKATTPSAVLFSTPKTVLLQHGRLRRVMPPWTERSPPLTHGVLALTLGVRRPSVTDALHILEGNLLIKAECSRILVRNREGLEKLAGVANSVPEAEYPRLFGPN